MRPKRPVSRSGRAEAVEGAQVVAFLLPDQVQKRVYEEDVAPNLADDAALVFAHGFNVHYGRISRRPATTS